MEEPLYDASIGNIHGIHDVGDWVCEQTSRSDGIAEEHSFDEDSILKSREAIGAKDERN